MKWWATTGQKGNYDWGDMDEPYLDLKGEGVFEDPTKEKLCRKYGALSHTASLMLLKIRLIRDLAALQRTNDLAAEKKDVLQEIWDGIRQQMVSSIIRSRKDVLESTDQRPLIKALKAQVEKIYDNLEEANKYLASALLTPGRHLTARPGAYGMGTVEEMQLALQYCYNSRQETPGALDSLRRLRLAKNGTSGVDEDVDGFRETVDVEWTTHEKERCLLCCPVKTFRPPAN
jgi:hypothetical protein